ncbi:RNA chaperone ProQ [Paraburkholderia domus]|uniref:ProQ/FinO family protein n=1 Tax=Paraburkholderia domus TaxID=2793075 RepID=UPI001912E06A|nr:ProQ/FinO family protein [Paraburkholderia domus]MBK5064510.1 ProQ/FinO family protein [Burkholderia sp. R-70199]MBK5091326.1 ProQ/FinO family protein [Burkholderia sp. R-69927]CAE6716251.1 RNA chaperone ProQ [Paraburkholderia domus]CAE6933478.1 RNA chaperone ProQ [Paraburkholderia domus]CAE6943433.1 RNA chaperone ProQ [Paraburkholderia domus]
MGFEQLAELKKQLAAARAEAAPAAKPVAKAGAKPPRKPSPPRRAAPAPKPAANAKPQADARPVDPVVKSIGKLQKRFPNAFPKNPAPKLPLKVGIFEDLVLHAKELSLSEAELRDAIKTWCRGSRYWKCLVDGAARVDLTGGEAGKVTAQESAGAQRLQAHRASRGAAKAAASAADASANASVASDVSADATAQATATPQGDAESQPQAASTDTPAAAESATPPAAPSATAEA